MLLWIPLLLLQTSGVGGEYDAHLSILGSALYQGLGDGGLAGVGDVNGDGIGDFLVGNHWSSTQIVTLYSGSDGSLIHTFSNGGQGRFGRHLANAGDVNADGINDYLIAAPDLNVGGLQWAGEVTLYSGADYSILHVIQGQHAGSHIGIVAAAGDVDADGYADFFIGAYMEDSGGYLDNGALYIYSGRTYSILHTTYGGRDYAFWGRAFGGGQDINLDGYDDFVAGTSEDNIVHLYSGIDGSILYTYQTSITYDRLGNDTCLVPDANGDGFPDFAIAAYQRDVGGVWDMGEVYIYSGVDGSLLWTFAGDTLFDRFGAEIAYIGDIDGNGNPDLAISAPSADAHSIYNNGAVYFYDLTTGERIGQAVGAKTSNGMGTNVSWVGDTTGDGTDNILVGEPDADYVGLFQSGAVHLLDFNPVLSSDQASLSAATGGVVNFSFDFPAHSAGLYFKLLGSNHGTGPSTVSGLEIPLSATGTIWDAMLAQPPPSVFSSAVGTLDAQGKATAVLTLPPGFASFLANSTVHFAVVSLWNPSSPLLSSVAIPLDILP